MGDGMLLIALVIAAQDPSPATVDRVTEEVSRTTRFGDAKGRRAAAACTCKKSGCACVGQALKTYDTEYVTSVDRPANITARAKPLFVDMDRERACVIAFEIALSSSESDISVDWSRVSLLIDGVARPAVPGFARSISNNLAQRPSTAPPGAILAERVFALTDKPPADYPDENACIGPRRSTVELDVPLRIGTADARVRFSEKPRPLEVTETTALGELEKPEVEHHQRVGGCSLLGEVDNEDDVAAVAAWAAMRKRLGLPTGVAAP